MGTATIVSALVIVDVQNDFLPGGALAVPGGDQVIPVINRLPPHFDLVIATQDWHPANHGSFAANHPGQSPGDVVDLHGRTQILWPTHCVQHTAGAAFAADLDTARVARVFQKGTDSAVDSYSGFFDNDHQNPTGLGAFLRQRDVTCVCVAGLATDYCVKCTVLDARALGLDTVLIEDACRGVGLKPGDADRAVDEMRRAGVTVRISQQIIEKGIRT